MNLKLRGDFQVIKYGWFDARIIANQNKVSRVAVYKDILKHYRLFNLWSYQYRVNNLWGMPEEQKTEMAKKIGAIYKQRGLYVQYKFREKKFLYKYSYMKYERSPYWARKRSEAYRERYNILKSVIMQYGLILMTEQYTIGTLKVGENCLLGRNVGIDYSGGLDLCDSVSLMDGVKILIHAYDSFNINNDNEYFPFSNYAFATPLKIGKNMMERMGLDKDKDIDYFLIHQTNKLIVDRIVKKLKLDESKVPYNLQEFGNLGGASIPMLMSSSIANDLSKRPLSLLCSSFGLGLTWVTIWMRTKPLLTMPVCHL